MKCCGCMHWYNDTGSLYGVCLFDQVERHQDCECKHPEYLAPAEMFQYDQSANTAAKVLDGYDFAEDIQWCRNAKWLSPWEIEQRLTSMYGEEVEDAISDLSSDEFMEYLSKRYDVRFVKETSYKMI